MVMVMGMGMGMGMGMLVSGQDHTKSNGDSFLRLSLSNDIPVKFIYNLARLKG